jgi:hypothetical protein
VAVGDGIEVGEGDCFCVGAIVAVGFINTVLAMVELLTGMGVFAWEDWGTAAREAQPGMSRASPPSNQKGFFMIFPIQLMICLDDYYYHTSMPTSRSMFVSGMSKQCL